MNSPYSPSVVTAELTTGEDKRQPAPLGCPPRKGEWSPHTLPWRSKPPDPSQRHPEGTAFAGMSQPSYWLLGNFGFSENSF